MNIAHCIHGLGLGGAQKVIKAIVQGGGAGDFRHFVYSPQDGVLREEIEHAGALVRILPRRLPKLDPFWVFALAGAMRIDRIDVVHTHLFGDSLHGYLAARLAGGIPVVMTLHIGAEGQTRLQRLGYRWLLGRTTHNIACTTSVGRSWSYVRRDVQVIPNGIEVPATTGGGGLTAQDAKARLGIGADTQVIGAIGRLVEQKGFDVLISAFARVANARDNHVRLVFIGDGPLRAELRRQAESDGVGHLVVFAGFRSDVADLLPAFDVVAFSSNFEGLPIALLEAMAAGRCIVGTDAPGIVDAVSAESEALIVPIGDVAALSAALVRALTDAELRQRLGEAARQRFVCEFTAERMVASYETVYRELCHRVAAPPTPVISERRIP